MKTHELLSRETRSLVPPKLISSAFVNRWVGLFFELVTDHGPADVFAFSGRRSRALLSQWAVALLRRSVGSSGISSTFWTLG